MALVVKDRVQETTTTTGTGTLTLGGAVLGFQTFAIIGNGNTTYYTIADPITGDYEVGIGTYTASGTTLSRTTVLESSNSGNLVNFAAGSKNVFCTYPAERAVYLDSAGSAVTTLDIGTLGASTANITTANITSGTVSTTPTNNTDIVNKQYADAIASGIHFHEAVDLATTAALPTNTYNNGTSGVGATLTATANGILSVDSTVTVVSNRILVKNEVTQANNGVYTVTQVGTAGTPYILTRATDFDTAGTGVDQIDEGDFFLVTSGTANVNTAWVQQTAPPITVGTTAIVFQQFSAPITYTAGTGLSESPSYTFNIANTGTAGTYGGAASVPVFTTNAQGQVTSVTPTGIAIASGAVSGLAASATTDTTNADNITSGTLGTSRLTGSYTGITGTGALAAGSLATGFTAVSAPLGGTGQTSYAVGDLLYASTTTTLSKLADVAVGNALISGGVGSAPSYGKIGLATHVDGTLPVANGGTNSTATPTTNGVAYGTGTAYAFTAAGTTGQVLVATTGSAPTWGSVSVTPATVSDQVNTSTGYFALPSGTTAQRPGSPASGYTRFNTTLNAVESYSGVSSAWEVLVYFSTPNAPTIGTATVISSTSATVTYTAPTYPAGNIPSTAITSYTAVSSPGGLTATVTQTTSGTITVTGLTPNTAYTFTVYATNVAGNSAASAASNSVTTWTVPGAPTIGTATTTGSTTATVSYTAPAFDGGTAITSYTATSSPGGLTGTLSQAGSGTITVTGLTTGTAYTFTVKANNVVGSSAESAASNSITTWSVPGAPTIGTASFNTVTATASVPFTAPASNGGQTITSYTAVSSPGGITGTLSQAGSGTISVTGLTNYTAYTFTVYATNSIGNSASSAASNSITAKPNTYTASYLAIAGGGCGGGQNGGGGGAGGMLTGTSTLTVGTVYSVVVGAGGISAQGGTTTALGLSLVGGGVGTGGAGGSGAGGFPGAGGAGTAGQGNPGGSGINGGSFPAGGGGGKGAQGGNAPNTSTGGTGGAGGVWSVNGTTYAGGGGGGVNPGSGGPGGSGGGGPGSTAAGSPTPGAVNTGSGGGGGNNNRAGTGGKGVVIFQVPTGSYTGTVTGSPTVATVGSDTRITFTQSGSYTA